MSNTYTVKLPPLLGWEVYESVDSWLTDPNNTPDQLTFAKQIVDSGGTGTLTLNMGEAGALYDELYNLEDKLAEWSESEFKWGSVLRSCRRHMNKLLSFGVELDEHGWSIK